MNARRTVVIVSDCHLSAGPYFEGRPNPHEDFHSDEQMRELFEYFSSGDYGGRHPVELIIGGDFLDFLNVPILGEFEAQITEESAVYKLQAILKAHPRVTQAIQSFASLPGKRVTYLVGNHDAELFFPQVQEQITRAWDPEGRFPSPVVEVVVSRDFLALGPGVEFRHGNQFEASNALDFEEPFYPASSANAAPTLKLPWGSIYILKIVNRLKWERETWDKVRPVKVAMLFGLILDPWFTVRLILLSGYYFLRTRVLPLIDPGTKIIPSLRHTFSILGEEFQVFQDLEEEARQLLTEREDLHTIIFGHTHRPMHKVFADGKQYLNTGTWIRMIDLDWRGLGRPFRKTFALVEFMESGESRAELREWHGEYRPHRRFSG